MCLQSWAFKVSVQFRVNMTVSVQSYMTISVKFRINKLWQFQFSAELICQFHFSSELIWQFHFSSELIWQFHFSSELIWQFQFRVNMAVSFQFRVNMAVPFQFRVNMAVSVQFRVSMTVFVQFRVNVTISVQFTATSTKSLHPNVESLLPSQCKQTAACLIWTAVGMLATKTGLTSSCRPSRTSSTHLLPLALYYLIWRQPSSNLCWKSHHLTKTFWKTTIPFLTYLFCPKFLKKSFSTNFSPISKKTTSAIPFSQPIEQDAALRPFCYIL